MSDTHPPALLDGLFSSEPLSVIFSDTGRLQAMLDVEAALTQAEAKVGVVPVSAVGPIAAECRAEYFDIASLSVSAASDGNVAIPVVRALTARVRDRDAEAAHFVHWGATSQDIIDTGLVLQARKALSVLESELERLIEATAVLVRAHRDTPMPGRTWLQQATPVTLGLKAAGWLDTLLRHRQRLDELRSRLLVLQFGGAAGTLASLGQDGLRVAAALGEALRLPLPALPWHAQRDRIVEAGSWLALVCGSLGKMARDISLLMQTEVAEVLEPAVPGKGGSSAMPHKRNPVGCAIVLAAATRAPGLVSILYSALPQEHERGLGNWPAEWQTLPELFCLTGAGLKQMNAVVAGLEVNTARMREHLDMNQGLVYAEAAMMQLARQLGRSQAHQLVERLSKEALAQGRHLREVLAADTQAAALLDGPALDAIFDPLGSIGMARAFAERVLGHKDLR